LSFCQLYTSVYYGAARLNEKIASLLSLIRAGDRHHAKKAKRPLATANDCTLAIQPALQETMNASSTLILLIFITWTEVEEMPRIVP
jgi:hypothetical protein